MHGPIALPDSTSVAAALITLDNHLNAGFFLPYPLPVLVEGGIFFCVYAPPPWPDWAMPGLST